MPDETPKFMDPPKAAAALRSVLDPRAMVTVADASAKSGLALRDAERGLQALTHEYRGQLRVTGEGELVYRFPFGFDKPWETRDAIDRFFGKVSRGFVGVMRFVARAWIAIVLVGYVAVFVALMLAMMFASRSNDNNNSRRSTGGFEVLFRVLADAMFWTFHPFSPFYLDTGPRYASTGWQRERRREQPKTPFYERVNRFLFGPTLPPVDERENERLITAAIRAGKGRIGLADVMRVTGLGREQVDPMMARLMLDYDGDVDVSEEGGIVYRFAALRKTAGDGATPEPPPFWRTTPARARLQPLTGNSFGENVLITLLNGFNLVMGLVAIENGLTLERAASLFQRLPHVLPPPGLPIVLGIIPVFFSVLLFLIPVVRAVKRPFAAKRVAEEKGRLAVLRTVLERVRARQPVRDADVETAWRVATEHDADPKRLARDLTAMGGDVQIEESGKTRWRFVDLETEAAALEAERQAAPEEEARLEKVVYSTEN